MVVRPGSTPKGLGPGRRPNSTGDRPGDPRRPADRVVGSPELPGGGHFYIDRINKLLREEPLFAEKFLTHLLTRNIKIEEDLVDQLFNSSEKRLARVLLLLANFGKDTKPEEVIPKISQETLAGIVGTTRSRVNFFMNRFRKLGFIDYNGTLHVNSALLTVVLRD